MKSVASSVPGERKLLDGLCPPAAAIALSVYPELGYAGSHATRSLFTLR